MAKSQKLGKGLGAIFGEDIDSVLDEITKNEAQNKGNSSKIKVKEIRPNPYQPRKTFDPDSLKELSEFSRLY